MSRFTWPNILNSIAQKNAGRPAAGTTGGDAQWKKKATTPTPTTGVRARTYFTFYMYQVYSGKQNSSGVPIHSKTTPSRKPKNVLLFSSTWHDIFVTNTGNNDPVLILGAVFFLSWQKPIFRVLSLYIARVVSTAVSGYTTAILAETTIHSTKWHHLRHFWFRDWLNQNHSHSGREYNMRLTLLEPQSRFGDKPFKFRSNLSPKLDCGSKRVKQWCDLNVDYIPGQRGMYVGQGASHTTLSKRQIIDI